ncbi:MAG: PAS domain S-box protein, partial [Proteobacteria bacterium]|nr:PAS domain S-box protein [Pseudomonadota bacterium]
MSDHRRTKVQLIEELRALRARVAEQERAEEALTKSEATLRSIHQAAPVGIGLVVGAERVLDWANERLARMTGYTREELGGMPARELYESREEYERVGRVKHADVRATGVGSVETRWRRKDGTVFDLLLSSARLTDDLEAGLVFTALDVTERKRFEDLLSRERDFSATVLDTVGSLVTVLDAEGRIVMFNRACREAGGFDFGEVKDRPFWEVFVPAEGRLGAQDIFEGMKSGDGPTSLVGPLLTKDRRKRIVAWTTTTLCRSDGSVRYVICAGTDITEQRRAERALRESERNYRRIFNATGEA